MRPRKPSRFVSRCYMREHVKHIHFVGIGGSGMSGIAEVLLNQNYQISGSDLADGAVVQRLIRSGATVNIGHCAENIHGCDVVVVSSAVDEQNPEVIAARDSAIPIVPRAEMLGELMRFSDEGIAVAGTHGKTTTTSLIAQVLAFGDLDPTFIVGGLVNSANSNSRLGKGKYLVAEADESDASFLHLQPRIAVVTNIDADHMETYQGDFSTLKKTFIDFLHNLPFYGLAVLCIDDPVIEEVRSQIQKPVLTYGESEQADYKVSNISQNALQTKFSVIFPNGEEADFNLAMPGKHNVLNAMAAIVVAHQFRVSMKDVDKALTEFEGIGRRFQNRGQIKSETGTFTLIDDYAHHPRELEATLLAAKDAWPEKRILVVFQPHRYSRTRDLLDDFSVVLEAQQPLIITEVYPAGEQPISAADGRALCRGIRARGISDPLFVEELSQLPELLDRVVNDDDVVLMLGAGDITHLAAQLEVNGSTQKVQS